MGASAIAAGRRTSNSARCWRCRAWPRYSTSCCPRVDFLSIGTNDLTQFLFAADRADPRLAERYDWLSPAILRFLRRVNAEAKAAGVPVRVCGEMAGRPLEAMALIGIGIDSFSITPAAVGPVKAMVRSIDASGGPGKGRGAACQAAAENAQIAGRLGQAPRRRNRLIFHLNVRLTAGHRLPTTDAISSAWRPRG